MALQIKRIKIHRPSPEELEVQRMDPVLQFQGPFHIGHRALHADGKEGWEKSSSSDTSTEPSQYPPNTTRMPLAPRMSKYLNPATAPLRILAMY